jgi:lysophospholipase L1-like esterase
MTETDAAERRSPWRRRSAMLGAALVLSVAGNVGLVRVAQALYAREQEVRLDPIGLRVHEDIRARANAHDHPVVAMFGDSRVAMWPTPTVEGYDVVNLGIGFQTTDQALLRFDEDVAPLRPAVVVLQVGVNDLKTLPLFPVRSDAIVRRCEANIARIVGKCSAIGAKVVLTTIFSLGDVPFYRRALASPRPTAEAIAEVNDFLRTLASSTVVVVESGSILDDAPGRIQRAFQVDFLHENAAAYGALDQRILPVVRSLGGAHP